MEVIKVNSEWDLGIYCMFLDYEVAREYVRKALVDCDIEESLEELEDNLYVTYEYIDIVEEV